jgi:hypothetical protein
MSIHHEHHEAAQPSVSDRAQWLAVIASGLLAAVITAVGMPAEAATASPQPQPATATAQPAP